jgi:hypothetical protein
MTDIIILLVVGSIFLTSGIICLIWPKRVQQAGLNSYRKNKVAARLNPFLEWMKDSSYILYLRIIGVIAVLVAFLVITLLVTVIIR